MSLNRKWAAMVRVFRPYHWIYLVLHAVVLLIGLLALSVDGTTWNAIGASLFASGLVGYVVFLYLWVGSETGDRLRTVDRLGIIEGFATRSISISPEYDERVNRASHQIDIIGFGLNSMREDHLGKFPAWAAKAPVRILLLDPEAPSPSMSYAAQRGLEEGDWDGTGPGRPPIESDVRAFVEQTRHLTGDAQLGGRFQVRLYTCLPSVNIFRVDDEMFWGPYLIPGPSRNTPSFIIRKGGLLFEPLACHFETIWASESLSRALPDSWIS